MKQKFLSEETYYKGEIKEGELIGPADAFSPSDKTWARKIHYTELNRQGPLNEETLFRKAIYWLLSAAETHTKQLKVYNQLCAHEYSTPEAILSEGSLEEIMAGKNESDLYRIMGQARYGQEKLKRLYPLADYWQSSEVAVGILNDVGNGREEGSELRRELVKNAKGMAEKVASCFLNSCGYLEFVPVDIHMLRHEHRLGILASNGKTIKVSDYRTNGGLQGKNYFKAEKVIADISYAAGIPPAIGQAALWKMYSRHSREYSKYGSGAYFQDILKEDVPKSEIRISRKSKKIGPANHRKKTHEQMKFDEFL